MPTTTGPPRLWLQIPHSQPEQPRAVCARCAVALKAGYILRCPDCEGLEYYYCTEDCLTADAVEHEWMWHSGAHARRPRGLPPPAARSRHDWAAPA